MKKGIYIDDIPKKVTLQSTEVQDYKFELENSRISTICWYNKNQILPT